ncbi:YopX family protein [uncultured Bacteroides sp.]|uniref:YopX family protein n=1 Tax=uncultured Bacteroides sp. TaxID=162156 RepID=UPI002592A1B9|nr:YopX family protein [uncultured Bacteroides sp.]
MEKDTKNRIVKFRGKEVNNGGWVFGSLLITDDNHNDPFRHTPLKKKYQIVAYFSGDWGMGRWGIVEIEHNTVGQFTGKTDKNKNDIYEGDIVRVYSKDGTFDIVVKWSNDSMAFMACYVDGNQSPFSWFTNLLMYELEVIGNIFENKQLLKGKQQ